MWNVLSRNTVAYHYLLRSQIKKEEYNLINLSLTFETASVTPKSVDRKTLLL